MYLTCMVKMDRALMIVIVTGFRWQGLSRKNLEADDQFSESNFEIYRAKVVAKKVHTMLDNGGGLEVYLKSLKKPHKYVAQGSLLSTNPTTKIGGVELGSQCWEVQINVPIEPNEPLLRSYGGFQTIGDAVGATVA